MNADKFPVVRVRYTLSGRTFQFIGLARVMGMNTGTAYSIRGRYKMYGYIKERLKQLIPVFVQSRSDIFFWEIDGGEKNPLEFVCLYRMRGGYGMLAERVEKVEPELAQRLRTLSKI